MAKKEDNYSWLDKYSTDPRDTEFRDITERHQDRQQYNTDRDAHDRETDGLNLAGSGTSTTGLYDDLVFDATRGHAPTAPPTAAAPTTARPAAPAAVPPPGSSVPSKRRVAPAPPQPAPPMAQRPERLPSIELAPLKPSPRVQRLPQPVPLHRDDASLLERLRKVPRVVYLPLIFGVLFLVSSLSDGGETTRTSDSATDRSPGAGTLISDLALGDCFLDPPAPRVASVQTTPCTRAHGGQVYAIVTGSLEEALQGCETAGRALAPEALSRLPDDATYTLLLNQPNHRCVLLSQSRGLIGSVTSD